MKKNLFICLLLVLTGMVVTGCGSCQSEKSKQDMKEVVYHDYDGVVQDFTGGVAQEQALHRQTMFALVGGDYEWRNSRIIFNDTVTYENIGDVHVTDVIDIFQYWDKGPWVQYISTNVTKGTQIPWPIDSPWIEDDDMSEETVKLTAEQALGRLKEYNGILPKGCDFMTLRLPVGPKACNPQWVFGDTFNVLFIDAVTGEVRNWNPAFPKPNN